MVEAILLDKKKILPCSVFLQGEYGVRDLFVGVPCKLGARGLEKIIEIKLTPDEDAAFKKSAAAVKELATSLRSELFRGLAPRTPPPPLARRCAALMFA